MGNDLSKHMHVRRSWFKPIATQNFRIGIWLRARRLWLTIIHVVRRILSTRTKDCNSSVVRTGSRLQRGCRHPRYGGLAKAQGDAPESLKLASQIISELTFPVRGSIKVKAAMMAWVKRASSIHWLFSSTSLQRSCVHLSTCTRVGSPKSLFSLKHASDDEKAQMSVSQPTVCEVTCNSAEVQAPPWYFERM